jgi:hypothetical protein
MFKIQPPTHRAILITSILLISLPILGLSLNAAAQTIEQTSTPVWGSDVRANSDTTEYSQHEPHIAISRTNPDVLVAVAKDYRTANTKEVWIYVSQDGGQTWPEDKQLLVPGLPTDIIEQSDPVVMARDDGRLYVVCLGRNSGTGSHGLFVTWSDDDGDTWADAVNITYNETPCCLDDKEWLAIDNNPDSPHYHNMYVAWANGGILFKRSTDGGETWSSYMNIAPGSTEYPYPIVGADGTLYVFYMDGWGYCADGHIRYRKSTDGGQTFSGPYTVTATSQPCSPIHGGGGYDQWRFFSIITAAADPNTPDNLWVAWTDDNDVNYGKTDVLYVRSTDGGTNWSAPERLSHDDPGAYVDHITPVFSIGADSRLHAFWLDRRDDPNNILFHAYHTATSDGGITWEPDTRVSDEAFDLNLYFPPPLFYNAAGDYWGLDTVGDVVVAAWNTTVETSQDIYVSRGVYTEAVTLTGQVNDSLSLLPIEAADVKVFFGPTVETDASGIYTTKLMPYTYTVRAQAEGYVSETITGVEVLSDTTILDFHLDPIPVTLSGHVTDAETLEPIEGAEVSVDSGPSAYTNPTGYYSLDLTPGVYTVTAEVTGYYSQSITSVDVFTDTVLDFDLVPISATLSGQVIDRVTLAPIHGAQVSVDSGQSTFTDPAGTYTITLTPGWYTATAQASGYYSQTVQNVAVLTDTVLNFSLEPLPPPTVTLTGQVYDATTLNPITGAEVGVDSGPGTITGLDGIYTLILSPGIYTATAQASGYLSQTVASIEVLSGTIQQDFPLEPIICPSPQILNVDISTNGLSTTFSSTISSTFPVNYLWNFGDGYTSTQDTPVHLYDDYGNYYVGLRVENDCGFDDWAGEVALWREYFLPFIARTD